MSARDSQTHFTRRRFSTSNASSRSKCNNCTIITLHSSHYNHHTTIITLHCRHGCICQRVACGHHGARLADRLCVPLLTPNVFVFLMHLQHFIQHILLSTLDVRVQPLHAPLFHICICRRGFRCRRRRKRRVRHYSSHMHLLHHHCKIVTPWFCARQCCVLFCLCSSCNFRANFRACFVLIVLQRIRRGPLIWSVHDGFWRGGRGGAAAQPLLAPDGAR